MKRTKGQGLRLAFTAAALCLAAAGALPAQQPASPPTSLEEQRVTAVRVVAESGEVLAENPPEFPVQSGTAYSAEAVREGLRQLHRSGRYADVRVEAAAAPGGLRLDFVVRPNFFVNAVRISGLKEPPSEALALASLPLGLGQPFRESLLREAIERLQETLREEGFYQARIERELAPHIEGQQMDITLRLTPGPRARIGAVTVRNLTRFTDDEVLRALKLRRGREVKTSRLARATDRLRRSLVKKGYLGARATLRRGDYDPQANLLPLTAEVSAGPRVRVEVSGVKISSRERRKLLPIYQEGAVDADLLQEGRRNLRDFLERDGYFDAEVNYAVSEDAENSQQVITYAVERGPRRRLAAVAFEGNRYFSDRLLRGQLRILPSAFLSPGRFSRRLLRDDEEALRGLYAANGFRDAQVRSEILEDFAGRKDDLLVRLRIAEGAQVRVAALRLEGNRALSEEELLAVAGSTPGQPFSEFNVAGDRDNILALYFNEGFPAARFEWTAEETGNPHTVRLTFRIHEGPQARVERVLLTGYQQTRRDVIAREVRLEPGEPLREGDLVETQRRLYNLGIFSRVTLAPQNPGGADTEKALVVQVEEAKRYTIAYGGGVEVQRLGSGGSDPVGGEVRASPRGLFEVTRANFLGRAHTVAFKARASTLQGRALLSYAAPNSFGRPELSLLLTGFADRTSDVRTFTSTRYEAAAQMEHRVSPFSSFLYRYAFRRVLVDPDSLRVSPEQIPLFSQPTKISALGLTGIRERRDNPADAARGSFNTADLSIAGRGLGSGASFVRFFAQNSSFHPLGRAVLFARSARIGIEETFGQSTPFDIPLPERFFAGGGNSLRGFGLNQAGPRDAKTGFPVGGTAMLVFNQELRFPLRLPLTEGKLGGAFFYDAGNVFSRANRITLRAEPRSPTDLNYFAHSVGVGLRYTTPIGPVRLDLGYLLNPARFEFCQPSATPAVPRCPAGQALRTGRLPRFQFFFNIGSVF